MARADQGTLAADDMPNVQAPVAPEQVTPENVAPERVYAGTFKDPDALEKGYGELKGKLDAQGGELGAIRGENKALQDRMAEMQQAPQTPNVPTTDYESAQAELAASYENGDIDFPTYARESNAMTAQAVSEQAQTQVEQILGQANDQFTQTLTERDDQVAVDKFLEQYPDFTEKQQSGALEQMRTSNPMFDDVTAYFAITAQEAKSAGMAEQARIESGSQTAGKVLADPGTAMQTPTKKPIGEAAIKASMLASLN